MEIELMTTEHVAHSPINPAIARSEFTPRKSQIAKQFRKSRGNAKLFFEKLRSLSFVS